MNRRIFLWPCEAPYSSESPGQAQPSVTEFRVPGSRGAVIVCPGGGYEVKAGHEGAPIAEMLSNAGISAYVLDYRVVPFHPLAPLSDALRAIRVVRSMGYEKVAILGFSAGGNLCCSAATHYDRGVSDSDDPIQRLSSRPDAFIPCYAVSACSSSPMAARASICWAAIPEIWKRCATSPRSRTSRPTRPRPFSGIRPRIRPCRWRTA